METRIIGYIDEQEDDLTQEVKLAMSRSMEDNLKLFCEVITANYAMAGIDVHNYPVKKDIYYIEDE